MKRWLIHLTIFSYLGCLSWGIFAHGTQTSPNASPAMYYIVWDMFCGWNAYTTRHHVIAEGESGKYYNVAPGPWGEFQPYGSQDRRQYDPSGKYCGKMGLNTLKHTAHEPITRVFVIEESWPKKYNMPDSYWALRYDEPKNISRYYHTRQVLTGEGYVLQNHSQWMSQQSQKIVLDNPQLRRDMSRNRPFFAVKTKPVSRNAQFDSQGRQRRFVNGN